MKKKTFKEWLDKANEEVKKKCGLEIDDLPDCPWREWYDSNTTPKSAANRAVKLAEE